MVNKSIKCAKCGLSSKGASVTFHRFPLPSKHGGLKARVWATFCFPDKDWSNQKSLEKLYTTHKMLCGRHFEDSSFSSSDRRRLNNFAIPTGSEDILQRLRKEEKLQGSPVKPCPRTSHQNQIYNDSVEQQLDRMNETTVYTTSDRCYDHDYGKEVDDENDDNVIDLQEEIIAAENEVKVLNEILPIKDEQVHVNLSCNLCHGEIRGFRYACLQCEDWDMCAGCEARGGHPHHYVLRIPAPASGLQASSDPVIATMRDQVLQLLQMTNELSEVYIKQEIKDEMTEEHDFDEDPFSESRNDRSVPETTSLDNDNSEDYIVEALESEDETELKIPINVVNQSADETSKTENKQPLLLVSPLTSTISEHSQAKSDKYKSKVSKPVIKVKRQSDTQLLKVITLPKNSKELPNVQSPLSVYTKNVVDALTKNKIVKLPMKRVISVQRSGPRTKMSTVVHIPDSISESKQIIKDSKQK